MVPMGIWQIDYKAKRVWQYVNVLRLNADSSINFASCLKYTNHTHYMGRSTSGPLNALFRVFLIECVCDALESLFIRFVTSLPVCIMKAIVQLTSFEVCVADCGLQQQQ
jgi:hypothetical protein